MISAFESIESPVLLTHVMEFLPDSPCYMADVGAGTGRDAGWFALNGHRVLAVEPVEEFRVAGRSLHPSQNIQWLGDHLPSLSKVIARDEKFDFILLAAVWQHIRSEDRPAALVNLRKILKDGCNMVMSMRHGPGAPGRKCYPIDMGSMLDLVKQCGFNVVCCKDAPSVQLNNRRADVTWSWLVVEASLRPNCGC